jgi:hypothetical protein
MENSAGTLQEKELAEEDSTPPLGITLRSWIQLTFVFVRISSSLSCYAVAFYPDPWHLHPVHAQLA